MKYVIASRRIGIVGEEYTGPEEDVARLLDGGFIESATRPAKSAKTEEENAKEIEAD